MLVDRDGHIIAGNKTVEQARSLNLPIAVVQTQGETLVVVQRTDLDLAADDRARQLAIADNRIAELDLDWDPEQLRAELERGLDLTTLWTLDELEHLLGTGLHQGHTDDDAVIEPVPGDVQPGDLFLLGEHRLLCGDSTNAADVGRLLGDATPALMVTDPPYGVEYDPAWRHRVAPDQRTAVGRVLNDDQADWRAAYRHFRGRRLRVARGAVRLCRGRRTGGGGLRDSGHKSSGSSSTLR